MRQLTSRHELTKSRFLDGLRCHKLMWWKAYERHAEELATGIVLLDRFDQGKQVELVAREQFPGGEVVAWPAWDVALRIEASRNLLDAPVPAVFQASFAADGVFVSVDVLQRLDAGGWALIEIKQNKSVKHEHLPDVAVQLYVARAAGVDVRLAEVMHLNPEYRHPGPEPLFVREDVTSHVEPLLTEIPQRIAQLRTALQASLPDAPRGLHCFEPHECPFFARCWPEAPEHVRHLAGIGPKKTVEYMERGIHWIADIPPDAKLSAEARRQIRAMERGGLVVEDGLARALEPLRPPVGYLDFETVAPAIPVWNGLAPHGAAAAQFSFHVEEADDSLRHSAYLAEGPDDPRPEVARRLIDATRGIGRIVTYGSFERTALEQLAAAVPQYAAGLEEIAARLVNLHAVVKRYVYHPEFHGSFSIKHVLPALVPELGYGDLAVQEGTEASALIARTMFVAHLMTPEERERLRAELLAYCERDTLGMVRLVQRLRELAGPRTPRPRP